MILRFVSSLLGILEFCMFARAICSWFPQMQQSVIYEILYTLTEPIIMPFRALFERVQRTSMFPIDIAYSVAFISLIIIQRLLFSL